MKLKTLLIAALDIVYPPRCLLCKVPLPSSGPIMLCDECLNNIEWIEGKICTKCGVPFVSREVDDHVCGSCILKGKYFDVARAAGLYSGGLAEAIIQLKYKRRYSVGICLSTMLNRRLDSIINIKNYDLIIPVPLHKRRYRERGFNQAHLLANKISKNRAIELDCLSLKRNRDTLPQVGLMGNDREKNVKGAFCIEKQRRDKIKDKRVLLIDDVYTTGATINECSKVLKKEGGARVVDVLTLTRAA